MNEELRERCIEAMAQASPIGLAPSSFSAMLDALLAVEGTCQTCLGTGEVGVLVQTVVTRCRTCGGSGSDGTPALVGMLMEQVGWSNGKEHEPRLVFDSPGHGWDILLYRVRPDDEAVAWKNPNLKVQPMSLDRVRPDTEGEK